MNDEAISQDVPHEKDHSDKFTNQADHDNCSEILREFQDDPAIFSQVKDGMRLDLTDDELLRQLQDRHGSSTLQSSNLDEAWDDFKGDFESNR